VKERLRALLLFSGLDDQQLDILAGGATEFTVAAGQPLIQRGDPGSGVFVLEEGAAVVEAPEGMRTLGPGDVFGERSLVDNGERTARVVAQTEVRCIAIPRPELERVIADAPQLYDRLRHLSG
jgi:CRP/FNR family transcriptional regulator, cyclic AMP receptor protein